MLRRITSPYSVVSSQRKARSRTGCLPLGPTSAGDQFTDDRGNRALRWTMVGKWMVDTSISKSFNIGGARYKLTVHGENILNEDKQLAKARWWDTSVAGSAEISRDYSGHFLG